MATTRTLRIAMPIALFLACTVTADAAVTVNSWFLRTFAFRGSGTITPANSALITTVTLPLSTTSSVTDTGTTSSTIYDFGVIGNTGSFKWNVSHATGTTNFADSESTGQIVFTASTGLRYKLSGNYALTGTHMVSMDVKLEDLTAGSAVLFNNHQQSNFTANQSFTLGGTAGDQLPQLSGAMQGNLPAGHQFRLTYALFIFKLSAGAGASASGALEMQIGEDCNTNGVPDQVDISSGAAGDCNTNTIPDSCDIASGAADCNANGTPDACELAGNDCNTDGTLDACQLSGNDCNGDTTLDVCQFSSNDCNTDGVFDACQLPGNDCNSNGTIDVCDFAITDCDSNGISDACELSGNDCNTNGQLDSCDLGLGAADCDTNGVIDVCDIAGGADDCNTNTQLDDCELSVGDCDDNGVLDVCEIGGNDCDGNGTLDACDSSGDCNSNSVPDGCELTGNDCNTNNTLDACEVGSEDCNTNGVIDACDLAGGAADCNANNVPDACELTGNDCNNNGTPDECDTIGGGGADCDNDNIPDECQLAGHDCNTNGVPDHCDAAAGDCNTNGVPDACDLTGNDCNNNGTPDACDLAGGYSHDNNHNGVPDDCNDPTVLVANQDTFMRDGADNVNEGANTMMRLTNGGNNRSIVAFNLSGVNLGGLTRATLVLTVSENGKNWGQSGRNIVTHRLTVPWVEGNGFNVGGNIRGTGIGATWECPADTNIHNRKNDCVGGWDGGTFAPRTAPPVLITKQTTGEVRFDVMTDVLNGASAGWVIKLENENAGGRIEFHTREGAASCGNANLAPRLLLEF